MIDPGEFLNNYAEWHYLWLGIFVGFLVGFAMGVYIHRRLRGLVQNDIFRSLTALKTLPPGRAVGERLVSHRIAGVERKLTTHTLESATDWSGARYTTIRASTSAPKTSSGIEYVTDSNKDR